MRWLLLMVAGVAVIGATASWATGSARAGPPPPTEPATTSTVAAPSAAAVTTVHTLRFDGLLRSYVLIRPTQVSTTKRPVLMVLHGSAVTPQMEIARTDFKAVAAGAILVYPAGYDESWNAGACCGGAQKAGVDDVGFLEAVLHQVLTSQPDASAQRVYVAGYSNGGKMALALSCADPHAFAGVGVYGAVSVAPCAHVPAVSLIEVASTGDPELTIGPGGTPHTAGSFVQPTVVGQTDAYRVASGCTSTSATTVVGRLQQTTWSGCPDGRRVSLALYRGGDHGWPSGDSRTPSAEAVIWSFFTKVGA
jgi:polyhydroxybutyrate depolymerase